MALNVRTIRDLATNKYVLVAQAIVGLAGAEKKEHRGRPSARHVAGLPRRRRNHAILGNFAGAGDASQS